MSKKKTKKKTRLKSVPAKQKKALAEAMVETALEAKAKATPPVTNVSINKQAEILQWLFYTDNRKEIARQCSVPDEKITIGTVKRVYEKYQNMIEIRRKELIEEGAFAPIRDMAMHVYLAASQKVLKKLSLNLVSAEDCIKLLRNVEQTIIAVQETDGGAKPSKMFPELSDEELNALVAKDQVGRPKKPGQRLKKLVEKQTNDDINSLPPNHPKQVLDDEEEEAV